jgi:hypothetical protein
VLPSVIAIAPPYKLALHSTKVDDSTLRNVPFPLIAPPMSEEVSKKKASITNMQSALYKQRVGANPEYIWQPEMKRAVETGNIPPCRSFCSQFNLVISCCEIHSVDQYHPTSSRFASPFPCAGSFMPESFDVLGAEPIRCSPSFRDLDPLECMRSLILRRKGIAKSFENINIEKQSC